MLLAAVPPYLALATGRAWIEARLEAAVRHSTIVTRWDVVRCRRVSRVELACTTRRVVITGRSCEIVVDGRLGAGGSFVVRRGRQFACRPH